MSNSTVTDPQSFDNAVALLGGTDGATSIRHSVLQGADVQQPELSSRLPSDPHRGSGSAKTNRIAVETFETSRLLDFCSEKELTNQVGHKKADWPAVVVKELMDNALDAAEEAGVAPDITLTVDEEGISVADNGPGIPHETVTGMLDYTKRVSSREAYVSPTRGAQGNALKTIVAMPYVLSGDSGRVHVTSHGQRIEITFSADHIRQEPRISTATVPVPGVNSGTVVKMWWPDSACSILTDARDRFLQLADDYLFLNPHLTLTVNAFGESVRTEATNPSWRKWRPCDPSSVHWYDLDRFERLIAACVARDQQNGADRCVRDFVRVFRGLTSTAKHKAVLQATRLDRTNLSSLANSDGFDHEATEKLLDAMKAQSKPVKPNAIGIIGKNHLAARFAPYCDIGSFKYRKVTAVDGNGIPSVIETAFAKLTKNKSIKGDSHRRLITGVNWSPAIGSPFRDLGGSQGGGLDGLLEQVRVSEGHPVMLVIHCACPRVQYTDRGKTNVTID